MFGKHFSSMYTGSMVGSGTLAFAVWGYCIANHDQDGFIEVNPKLLATIFGDTTPEEIQAVLDQFCEPDKQSRTPEQEGRRLTKEGPFLYHMVNAVKYRKLKDLDARRRQNREAQRRRRVKIDKMSANVSNNNLMSSTSAHTDKDKQQDTDTDKENNKKEIFSSDKLVGCCDLVEVTKQRDYFRKRLNEIYPNLTKRETLTMNKFIRQLECCAMKNKGVQVFKEALGTLQKSTESQIQNRIGYIVGAIQNIVEDKN